MSSESLASTAASGAETRIESLGWIRCTHEIRPVNLQYVERLRAKVREIGVKPYPLSVTPDGVLFGGRHRYEAFKAEGITECLMHIHQPDNLDREAIELNRASEDALPMTFVDYAELVWRRLEEQTQQQTAEALGWSREAVKDYAALSKIGPDAWKVIGATIRKDAPTEADDDAPTIGAIAPFTAGLLRNILDLTAEQQMDLCRLLVKGKDGKGRAFGKAEFKKAAERRRAENALADAARRRLADALPASAVEQYVSQLLDTLVSASDYIDEYLAKKMPGDKFERLIDSVIDAWQKKNNIRIIVKDIRLLTDDDIEGGSVDVIITDPPYPADYIDLFDELGKLADFALKPGGSLIAMTGQLYLPRYIELLSRHLTYHWTLAYLTPGGQAVQVWNREVSTFWKPLLWFVKGDRDGRWVSDVIKTPANANDKEHHHWGQSIDGMLSIVEKFSNPGDVVLDPFLGGGTTALACKQLNRKFVGVEIDQAVASRAMSRMEAIDEAA